MDAPPPHGVRRGRSGGVLFQKGEADLGGETSLSHKRDGFLRALLNHCSGHVFTSFPTQVAPMAHPLAGWPISVVAW